MSLATRCAACGTVFRVVQDQLKVSEGWVRCGRCQDVFNALDGLFDLDRETPPLKERRATPEFLDPLGGEAGHGPGPGGAQWQPTRADSGGLGESVSGRTPLEPAQPPKTGTPPVSIKTALAGLSPLGITISPQAGAAAATPADVDLLLPDTLDPADSRPDELFDALIEQRPPATSPARNAAGDDDAPGDLVDADGFADARFNSRLFADDAAAASGADTATEVAFLVADAADAAATPEFVREAERAARQQSPRTRAAYGLASLLLAAVLCIQIGLHFHDRLAADWPGLREPLAVLCEIGGCDIQAPLQIDALSVDSSGLTEMAQGGAYRLSVVLRNRAPHPVRAPSVDLSLTDANGRLIARRMLSPRDFAVTQPALEPASDAAWQVLVSADESRIAGYAIEIFYP